MGYCAGYDSPGYTRPGFGAGRGFGGGGGGWGRGRGRGWRHRYYATGVPGWAAGYAPQPGPADAAPYPSQQAAPNPEHELTYLQTQAEALQEQLSQIQQRISELESQD